ncbi:MAG: Uncharacterised protein [Synechococcus sp. CC9902]|nr:MAG: Uncharacterised protein [Synechococcus sp. CC9902]
MSELVLNDPENPLTATENVLVISNFGDQVLMFKADLVGLECREAAQLHLEDRIGLNVREAMALLKLKPGGCGVGSSTDQGDDRVELIQGQQQAEQDVIALLRFSQEVAGATLDRLDAEVEEHLEHLPQGEQDRFPIHQREHVSAEIALQRRQLEEVVQHHLWIGITAELHHDAHAVTIAFVPDV